MVGNLYNVSFSCLSFFHFLSVGWATVFRFYSLSFVLFVRSSLWLSTMSKIMSTKSSLDSHFISKELKVYVVCFFYCVSLTLCMWTLQVQQERQKKKTTILNSMRIVNNVIVTDNVQILFLLFYLTFSSLLAMLL